MCFKKGTVPDDAVEALAGSLGKKEADPEGGKPVEDQVKVMAAQVLVERDYRWSPSLPNKSVILKKYFPQRMTSWLSLLLCTSWLIN